MGGVPGLCRRGRRCIVESLSSVRLGRPGREVPGGAVPLPPAGDEPWGGGGLCQGESGSGAHLGARDDRRGASPVWDPAVRPDV
jgi:hypothetical protein